VAVGQDYQIDGKKILGEDACAYIPDVGAGELVVGEDGVGVDASGLDDVGPAAALGPADEDDLDDEEGGGVGEVLLLTGGVPERRVEDADLGQELRDENAGRAEHRPPAVHQLRLHVPPQALWIRSCRRARASAWTVNYHQKIETYVVQEKRLIDR
jgi:hypothetical protein